MSGFTEASAGTYSVTILTSDVYDITLDGAQGGGGHLGENTGGVGASVSGDIYLQTGTVLEIVVGR